MGVLMEHLEGHSCSMACATCVSVGACSNELGECDPCPGVELPSKAEMYRRARENYDNTRHHLSKILMRSNPILERMDSEAALKAGAMHPIWGTVSSEPPCSCPEEQAISRDCSRHAFMWDWAGQDPFKDHLRDYEINKILSAAGVPQPNWRTLQEQWHAAIQGAWRQEYDALMMTVASDASIPPGILMPLDDVLLSYSSIYGERTTRIKAYVPPKYTVRQRFRIWRNRKNREIQQWIHDHLTEAYCDC